MDHTEFHQRTIDAYHKAREDGFDHFAEALLAVLQANARAAGVGDALDMPNTAASPPRVRVLQGH